MKASKKIVAEYHKILTDVLNLAAKQYYKIHARFPSEWSEIDILNYQQRQIILFSMLYYREAISAVPDYEYDMFSHGLAERLHACPDKEKTRYWYVFNDFEGSTGFYLVGRLTWDDRMYLEDIQERYLEQVKYAR